MARGVKTGGRKAGTLNKKTIFLSEEFQKVGFNWGEAFQEAWQANETSKLRVLVELLPFLVAKLKEREVETDEDESQEENSSVETADLLKMITK